MSGSERLLPLLTTSCGLMACEVHQQALEIALGVDGNYNLITPLIPSTNLNSLNN